MGRAGGRGRDQTLQDRIHRAAGRPRRRTDELRKRDDAAERRQRLLGGDHDAGRPQPLQRVRSLRRPGRGQPLRRGRAQLSLGDRRQPERRRRRRAGHRLRHQPLLRQQGLRLRPHDHRHGPRPDGRSGQRRGSLKGQAQRQGHPEQRPQQLLLRMEAGALRVRMGQGAVLPPQTLPEDNLEHKGLFFNANRPQRQHDLPGAPGRPEHRKRPALGLRPRHVQDENARRTGASRSKKPAP